MRGGCSWRGSGGGGARQGDVGVGCWTPYHPPSLLPPAGQPTPARCRGRDNSVSISGNLYKRLQLLDALPHFVDTSPRLFQLLLLKMVSHFRATFRILQVLFGKQHGCRRLAGWVLHGGRLKDLRLKDRLGGGGSGKDSFAGGDTEPGGVVGRRQGKPPQRFTPTANRI